MGRLTNASGQFSTVMGFVTTASGKASTAMGNGTIANEDNMTVVGKFNSYLDRNSSTLFVVGNGKDLNIDNYIDGSERINSFVVTDQNTSVYGKLFVNDVEITPSVGGGSTVDINLSTAVNRNSVLNSSDISQTGSNAFATGNGTNASGEDSTAMGDSTEAQGDSSIAVGYYSIASAFASVAMGESTTASGDYSTATGYYTTASGESSTAFGKDTEASGAQSTAMGNGTVANEDNMTAIGKFNSYLDRNSSTLFVVGNGKAYNDRNNSFVVTDRNTSVYGKLFLNDVEITAGGGGGTVSADTILNRTGVTQTGMNAFATGLGTTASGFISTAMGYGTIASGDMSTAMGYRTTAPSYASLVIGRYNSITGTENNSSWVNSDPLFVIGNGTDGNNRSNALTVYKNGNATLSGTLTENSDSRLKKDIQQIENALEKVSQINGVTYNWNKENMDSARQMGVIAQDVQKVAPELIKEDSEGYLSVSYSNMNGLLVEAIKEQKSIDENQSETLKTQNETIKELKAEIESKDQKIKEQDEKIAKILNALKTLGVNLE